MRNDAAEREHAMSFRIRVATLYDAEGVSALLAASYPVFMKDAYDADVLKPAIALMTRAQPALLESGTFYVAETDSGQIVGCGGHRALRLPGVTERGRLLRGARLYSHPADRGGDGSRSPIA